MMLVAGFIGLNCALSSLVDVGAALVNQGKLIYACSVLDLKRVERNLRHHFHAMTTTAIWCANGLVRIGRVPLSTTGWQVTCCRSMVMNRRDATGRV